VTEDEILAFVRQSFRSVWPLELLLVLSQEPVQDWTVDALAREVRASSVVVVRGLQALQAAGLVASETHQGYRFRPVAESAEMARGLIDLYNRKPRAVTRAVFAAPRDRIQSFADAFRLRKDPC
jgi:hypothetical protein